MRRPYIGPVIGSAVVPGRLMFSIPVVINYEDTDAAGVVYYANYLAYMERARNACLREAGFPLAVVRDEHKVVFVVIEANLRYRRPATLDNVVDITLEVESVRGASMTFVQQVRRDGELLVDGRIRVGTLTSDTFLPCRIPDDIRHALDVHRIQ